MSGAVPWRRYVALGDSFTEGLWDGPDEQSDQRGWADRLASALAWRIGPDASEPLTYANLAIRGRLLRPVIAEQLRPALAMKPDLVSLAAGGNDLLRLGVAVDPLIAVMDRAIRAIRATGADVLLSTCSDPVNTPVIRQVRSKAAIYYLGVWSLARRHGAYIVDLWGMSSLRDLRMLAPDRLHLNGEGHRRVANAALVALGLDPDDPDFDVPLPPAARPAVRERAEGHAQWSRDHLFPWMQRHFQGRSSGDGRTPKRPALAPIAPERAVP